MRGRRHCCCCRRDSDEEDEICTEHGPPELPKGCRQCLVDKFIEEAKRVGTVTEDEGWHYTIEIPVIGGAWQESADIVRVVCTESRILGLTLGENDCFYEVEIDTEYDTVSFGQASYSGYKEWLVWRKGGFYLSGRQNEHPWDFDHRCGTASIWRPKKPAE